MNLAKAKRDELLGPLSAVSGIIERRHTLPILSNVLIERSGDALSFLATDIEIQIAVAQRISVRLEAHGATVAFHTNESVGRHQISMRAVEAFAFDDEVTDAARCRLDEDAVHRPQLLALGSAYGDALEVAGRGADVGRVQIAEASVMCFHFPLRRPRRSNSNARRDTRANAPNFAVIS